MTHTTISDVVIWAKHLGGAPRERILALRPGELLMLKVDGVPGSWRKMDDGRDGRPTLGVRPMGPAAELWRRLYRERRGQIVAVEIADASNRAPIPICPSPATSEAERQAAIESFLGLAGQGWRSDGPYGPRDELYDRE